MVYTQLTEMFRHSDPAALMDEAEQAQLAELDDTVTVYRGVTTINSDNLLALSWTLDYETADWFARRFDEDGTVYKAQIDKEHIFRHYLRWPYPMYKPSQFDSFNHEHTCLASKLTNIELSDICPLAKAGQPFEVARENTCEECKYFCRIHYEVDPEYGDKQVHFWMNEEIVTFF